LIEDHDPAWLYWCPGLAPERWREECRLVEERSSLFQSFAETPFFGFRGLVSRAGCEYGVTVAAEIDMYPKYQPWVFVTPAVAGANADGKLCLDLPWNPGTSLFADVVESLVRHIEVASRTLPGTGCA